MNTPREFTAELWRVYHVARIQLANDPALLATADQQKAWLRDRTVSWGIDLADRRQLRAFAAALAVVSMAVNAADDVTRGTVDEIITNASVAITEYIPDTHP